MRQLGFSILGKTLSWHQLLENSLHAGSTSSDLEAESLVLPANILINKDAKVCASNIPEDLC